MTVQTLNVTTQNVAALNVTMGQTRIAANTVAEKLFAAEAAIDAAIAAVASLAAQVPLATLETKVGPHVMQEALMHAMESCQLLVKSRTNIIRTHSALRTAQDTVGIGDMQGCPKSAELAPQPVRHLSVVAA